jgi:type VI secretion system secreted protein VgrG
MDDSPGEVGLRLASSTADTALSLGHIATPRKKGEAVHRGTGVELRTEGAAVLRAAQGVLVTTFGAAKEAPHLAHDQSRKLLAERRELFDQFVQALQASPLKAPTDDACTSVNAALDTWRDHPAQPATPAIVVASPHTIGSTTGQSHLLHAARQVDIAAGGCIQMQTAQAIQLAAAEGLECYAADGGIAAYAQNGEIALTTATDRVRVTSASDILLQALNGTIRLEAEKIEIVTTDGSILTLSDAIKAASPGIVDMHGVDTRLHGPQATLLSAPVMTTTDMAKEEPRYAAHSHQDETQ